MARFPSYHLGAMNHQRGFYFAVSAALLFGLGAPLIKLWFGAVDPILLAALISLGSGIGVGILTRASWNPAPFFTRENIGFFLAVLASGGVAAPFLLVWGTSHGSASTASLLLNLEAVFTTLVACLFFRDRISVRMILGLILVTGGGIAVSGHSTHPDGHGNSVLAGFAIAGTCLAWAFDNNCMIRLRGVSPGQITLWKGLLAGLILLAAALASGTPLPGFPVMGFAFLLGTGCFGLALLLFVHALKNSGAGRASAYFATAPFIGATASIVLLDDPMSPRLIFSALLMAAGLAIFFEKLPSAHPTHGAEKATEPTQ